jgi:hypothetical protein
MKKVLLILMLGVFAFGGSGYMSSQEALSSSPSDCVRYARHHTLIVANDLGQHPNDDWEGLYLDVYMHFYNGCIED